MSRIGWVTRAAEIARQEECNVESSRLRQFGSGGGQLPDDDDAAAYTILDTMCRAIRKARRELEALEHLERQGDEYRRRRVFP